MAGEKRNGAGKSNGSTPHLPKLSTDDDQAPPEIAELVAACVRFVKTKYKTDLDFSEDTLPLVDQYVRDARAEVTARPETLDLVQGSVGAYFGEVARRRFGGFWECGGDASEWKLMLEPVYLSFNPIAIAREAVLEGDAEGWSAHFKTDPGEKDIVIEKLAQLPPVPEEEYYLPSTRFEVLAMVVDALRAHMEANGTGDVTFGPEDYDEESS